MEEEEEVEEEEEGCEGEECEGDDVVTVSWKDPRFVV